MAIPEHEAHTLRHLESRILETDMTAQNILTAEDKTTVAWAVPDLAVTGVIVAKDGALCELRAARAGAENTRVIPHNMVELVERGTRTVDMLRAIERAERIAEADVPGDRLDIQHIVFADEKIPPNTLELDPEVAKEILRTAIHEERVVREPTSFLHHLEWLKKVQEAKTPLEEGVEVVIDRPDFDSKRAA